MQEELENKTVNLAVTTGKLSARTLCKALKLYVDHQKARRAQKKNSCVKGKQSVKKLVGQGQGVSSMEIGDSGLRDFKRIANKYGVDFAIVKDKAEDTAKYTVFFKAKDADAITKVLKDYSAKQLKRNERKEKPSILAKLKKFKELVSKTPRRVKEKKKGRER